MTFLLTAIIFLYITSSILYIILGKGKNSSKNDDDDGGGIEIENVPDIDLPPGVTLPTKDVDSVSK